MVRGTLKDRIGFTFDIFIADGARMIQSPSYFLQGRGSASSFFGQFEIVGIKGLWKVLIYTSLAETTISYLEWAYLSCRFVSRMGVPKQPFSI